MYLDQFIDYKYTIIEKLIQSQAIVDLLTNQVGYDLDTADILINNLIWDCPYIPDVDDITKNYITLSTKASQIDNFKLLEIQTIIYIMIPYTQIKLPPDFKRKGNRLDALIKETVQLFNGSRDFGIGKIHMLPNQPFAPDNKHLGFMIPFKTTDFNT